MGRGEGPGMALNTHSCPPGMQHLREDFSNATNRPLASPALLPRVARDPGISAVWTWSLRGWAGCRACAEAPGWELGVGGVGGHPGARALVPPWGPPLKLEEKSLTARTEQRRETQVGSALPTDILIKENSLGNT